MRSGQVDWMGWGTRTRTYPLGTDHIGRDVLSRLLYGARMSLGVGSAATTLSVMVSLLIGGVAGFAGGKLDLAVQRVVDAWMSFPGLLLLTSMTIVEFVVADAAAPRVAQHHGAGHHHLLDHGRDT